MMIAAAVAVYVTRTTTHPTHRRRTHLENITYYVCGMYVCMQSIDGLAIVGNPVMTGFAIQSTDPAVNIFAVADVMETKGCVVLRATRTRCEQTTRELA